MEDGNWRDKDPTDEQLNLIHHIEEHLGLMFDGSSYGEASDFITANVSNYVRKSSIEEWRKLPIAPDQLRIASDIVRTLGVEFHGKTRGEICDFIDEHYEEFWPRWYETHVIQGDA